jgi:hypothetical protein
MPESMTDQEFVQIPLSGALEIASFLEQLTLSLDRIGSRAGGGLDGPRMLWNFTDDANTFQRASSLRHILWDACATILSEEQIETIAEQIPTFPQVGGRDYH